MQTWGENTKLDMTLLPLNVFFKCLFHLDRTRALGLEVAPRLWQQDSAAEAGEGSADGVAAADGPYSGKK